MTDTDRQLWLRARDILESLLDLPVEQRHGELLASTAGEDGLQEEVLSLLRAHEQSHDFLEEPFARLVDRDDLPPTESFSQDPPSSLGHYKILRLLGQGGMGRVYLAARADDEYRDRVAIKILRSDVANEELTRRFRDERQILANLTHPNIARLLDGGSTQDGRPYLVMEYVEGEPIDRYCAENQLSVEERLRLMRKVCGAVHAAHQRRIVHRDLKPGNILVDRDGEPKLLDFGIAKLLRSEDWSSTLAATAPNLAPMTLEYSSPEQLRNQQVTTASDVYSLGVVLYELLTGRRPFRLADQTLERFLTAVCEREPPAPSAVILEEAEGEQPRQLRRQLAGDLDNIVSMALSKDPQRRYSSATELARDLERHSEGLPVTARAATLSYRSGKFLRRHRWAVTAAAAVALAFIAFTVTLFFQQRQTLREKSRAQEVTSFLTNLFKSADPDRARGESFTVREGLDLGTREVEERLEDDSWLKAELRGVVGQVYRNLGLYDEAWPLAEGAYELNLELHGEASTNTEISRQLLGDLEHDLGNYEASERRYRDSLEALGSSGDPVRIETGLAGLARALRFQAQQAEAEEIRRQALDLARELHGEEHERVASNLYELAGLLREREAWEEAQLSYLRALEIYRGLYGDRHPEPARVVIALGLLEEEQGSYETAEARYREADSLRREIYGDRHPVVAQSTYLLANISRLLGQLDEAESLCRETLDVRHEVYGESHPQVAHSLSLLGLIAKGRGQNAEAADRFQEALTMFLETVKTDHPWVASAHNNLASALQESGEPARALEHYEAALPIYRQTFGSEHMQVATVLNNLATLHKANGELTLAERRYREALEILRAVQGDDHINVAQARLNLATLQLSRGEPEIAERLYRQALPVLRSQLGDAHAAVAVCLNNLGRALLARGELEEAAASVNAALDIYKTAVPEDHLWRLLALGAQGEILTEQRQYPEAERVLLDSHQRIRAQYDEGSARVRDACRRLADLYDAWGRASGARGWRECSI